jgi:hypothetical protein
VLGVADDLVERVVAVGDRQRQGITGLDVVTFPAR